VGEKEVGGGYFFLNQFGGQHVLVELAELIGHRGLIDAIVRRVRLVELAEGGSGPTPVLAFLALAYRHTGEECFREAISRAVDARRIEWQTVGGSGALDEPPHRVLAGQSRINKIACLLGDVLNLVPYGLAALGAADGDD